MNLNTDQKGNLEALVSFADFSTRPKPVRSSPSSASLKIIMFLNAEATEQILPEKGTNAAFHY